MFLREYSTLGQALQFIRFPMMTDTYYRGLGGMYWQLLRLDCTLCAFKELYCHRDKIVRVPETGEALIFGVGHLGNGTVERGSTRAILKASNHPFCSPCTPNLKNCYKASYLTRICRSFPKTLAMSPTNLLVL